MLKNGAHLTALFEYVSYSEDVGVHKSKQNPHFIHCFLVINTQLHVSNSAVRRTTHSQPIYLAIMFLLHSSESVSLWIEKRLLYR